MLFYGIVLVVIFEIVAAGIIWTIIQQGFPNLSLHTANLVCLGIAAHLAKEVGSDIWLDAAVLAIMISLMNLWESACL